jgi:ABC-type Mn2+/Zn2+ transport system ATPase subunit
MLAVCYTGVLTNEWLAMLKSIYIHNFGCLQNFEYATTDARSMLLLGKNGAGKTTLAKCFSILQRIGEGENSVGVLFNKKNWAFGDTTQPIHFEIQVSLDQNTFKYTLLIDFPESFKNPKINKEVLELDGNIVFSREDGQVSYQAKSDRQIEFLVDWHLIALPIINTRSDLDPVAKLKKWLAQIIVIAPCPEYMIGESHKENLCVKPNFLATNVGNWLTGLFSQHPSAYSSVSDFLKKIMPDFEKITNPKTSDSSNKIMITFKDKNKILEISFENLSHGEKCFVVAALLLATHQEYPDIFCIWDEPDNFISVIEIEQLVFSLQKNFSENGQFSVISHNTETMRFFSGENILIMKRESHLLPARLTKLSDQQQYDIPVSEAIIMGLIEL